MKSGTEDDLKTPAELALLLKVSLRTVLRLSVARAIPVVRVGCRRPRYRLSEVLDALNVEAKAGNQKGGMAQ